MLQLPPDPAVTGGPLVPLCRDRSGGPVPRVPSPSRQPLSPHALYVYTESAVGRRSVAPCCHRASVVAGGAAAVWGRHERHAHRPAPSIERADRLLAFLDFQILALYDRVLKAPVILYGGLCNCVAAALVPSVLVLFLHTAASLFLDTAKSPSLPSGRSWN